MIVANPRRVRLIAESDKKSDRFDAEQLARLGRIDPDLLSPIVHRGEEAQRDRILLLARDGMVRARTQLINQVRGFAKSLGSRLPSSSSEVSVVIIGTPRNCWVLRVRRIRLRQQLGARRLRLPEHRHGAHAREKQERAGDRPARKPDSRGITPLVEAYPQPSSTPAEWRHGHEGLRRRRPAPASSAPSDGKGAAGAQSRPGS